MQQLFPNEQIEEWLQICSDASLLRIQEDRWRFTHDKIRETLLAGMADDEQRRLFRQVAQATEAVHNPDEYAPRLAHYWQNAQDTGQEARYQLLRANRRSKMAHCEAAVTLTAC
jgi:hypothetical protein